jgi:hypothetical protein
MRRCRFASVVVLIASGLVSTGCSRQPRGPAPVAGAEPTTAATDEEAQTAATALEAAVRSGDRPRAFQEFALEVIAHRVVTGLPVNPDRLPDLLKLIPARADTNELVSRILSNADKVGGFRLLQVRPADGRHVARFRLSLGKAGVHYFDMVLARFPSGRTGVEELIDLNDGERLTDTIRREILPAAALRDPSLEARLSEEDRLYLAHSTKVADLKRALGDRRWKDATALYEGLPAGLRDRKPVRFGYARALVVGRAGWSAEHAALADCREQYPNDPATDLLAVVFHANHREYTAVARVAAALRQSIGEDAVLNVVESGALAMTGQRKAATAAAERAVRAEPECKEAYQIRVAIAVDVGDNATALEWMKRALERTGMQFDDLPRNPEYARFVKSPQYQEWLTWTATHPGP